jgi:uncharacterized membrane protein YphA (DoxX/SURF4 family)
LAKLNRILVIFSAVSFFAYGAASFASAQMKQEFRRYGFEAWRPLIGGLQVAAAVGLLAGFSQPWIGRLAAAGLALMMLGAVAVRLKIRDNLFQTLPALTYLGVNGYLCWASY